MSLPNIPDITPEIDVTTEKAANMLLSSIALEGLGLSHIINAEGEKIQYMLGTLETNNINRCSEYISIDSILKANKSIDKTLSGIIKNQILLQLKLENTLELFDTVYSATSSDTKYNKRYNQISLQKIINDTLEEENTTDNNKDENEYVECKASYFDDWDE